MKNTWLAILLVSLVAQAAVLGPAHAQVKAAEKAAEKIANFALRKKPKAVAEVVEKAPEVAPSGLKERLKKFYGTMWMDPRFVASLTVDKVIWIGAGLLSYEIATPHLVKSLCRLEAKTMKRGTLFLKPESCALFYGDGKFNSCQVANNGVAILLPTDQKNVAIRYVGDFKDGKLQSVTQAYVKLKSENKHDFELIGTPVQMYFNSSDLASDLRPYPGVSILKNNIQSQKEADAFKFYEEVGAVMRLANTECSEGKYEKMIQEIATKYKAPAAQSAKQ